MYKCNLIDTQKEGWRSLRQFSRNWKSLNSISWKSVIPNFTRIVRIEQSWPATYPPPPMKQIIPLTMLIFRNTFFKEFCPNRRKCMENRAKFSRSLLSRAWLPLSRFSQNSRWFHNFSLRTPAPNFMKIQRTVPWFIQIHKRTDRQMWSPHNASFLSHH